MATMIVPDDVAELAFDVAGHHGESWIHNCHVASIEIVKSGLFPGSRVARGHADGVGIGQHSWVVLPHDEEILADCYDPTARILDPTLWSYDDSVSGVWTGHGFERHVPHGTGHLKIEDLPVFRGDTDNVIELPKEVADGLSYRARDFLLRVGAISYGSRTVALPARNWMSIANAPVQGWPSPEIIEAMARTPQLSPFTRIDIVGMLTAINPGGMYLPGEESR
jgi:hypothetical protein